MSSKYSNSNCDSNWSCECKSRCRSKQVHKARWAAISFYVKKRNNRMIYDKKKPNIIEAKQSNDIIESIDLDTQEFPTLSDIPTSVSVSVPRIKFDTNLNKMVIEYIEQNNIPNTDNSEINLSVLNYDEKIKLFELRDLIKL